MSSESDHRDPYGQALNTLRRLAFEGRFGWGAPVVIKDLAAEIGLSPTPVREALARLSGEGLIERRPGRGYFYPALTASDVIDLFDLQWSYVHAALVLHGPRPASLRKLSGPEPSSTFDDLFAAVVAQTGNDALVLAHNRVLERLAPVSRALAAIGRPLAPRASEIGEAFAAADLDLALDLIATHQVQRHELAGEVARVLQRGIEQKV